MLESDHRYLIMGYAEKLTKISVKFRIYTSRCFEGVVLAFNNCLN